MRSKFRSSLAVALATAVTLTSFSLAPAQAAPQNTPKVTNASGVDLSARRRHYRGNNAAALAMFGAKGQIGLQIVVRRVQPIR